MHRTIRRAIALGAVLALAISSPAGAIDPDEEGALPILSDAVESRLHHQHGEPDGHLPPSQSATVELVSKTRINQDQEGRVADVGALGNYAYLAAWAEPRCQKGGVYVFDINDPANPKQINFIRTANDSYAGEGVHAIHLSTSAFTGDVLAFNNESCLNQAGKTSKHAIGGFTLVDVTNPKTHKFLVEGFGDRNTPTLTNEPVAHEIHSVFIWEDDNGTPGNHSDDRAYAVTVDNEEDIDVDIFDITDPRNPFKVIEFEADARFPQIVQPDLGANSSFLHDVIVKQIGGSYVMLLSNWDGGYVTVNVDDPSNPTYIGDTDFTNPDPEAAESGLAVPPEGNGHQAEFSLTDNYIVAADEDFDPYKVTATTDDGTIIEGASPGSDTPPLEQGETISGRAVYVGRACPGDPAVPAADADEDQIAIVERGVCTFTEKIAAVDAAGGYEAAIVFNRTAPDGCDNTAGMLVAGSTPTFGVIPRQTGFSFFDAEASYNQAACEAGDGTQLGPFTIDQEGDVITLLSYFDGWGYVHLYQNGAGKLAELDTYAIPQAHDPAFASGFGDLSVHEVAMSEDRNDLAYFSYYSGGFRVAEIQGNELVEVGHFIDEGGNNFWGVQVWQHGGQEYVLASDRDFGLYIFQYTGP
jgi:hypothetical protein